MYSMPIVGTSANLYFPNERNEEPIVIGCVRKNGSSSEKFANVNNRYFATESGNNLDLLPGAINFTRPGLRATFNDGGGINLNSSSTLSLNAGYVGLFAGDITIHGESKVVAQKGGSFISLEGEFFNDAGIVMENGSDRASNGPFDDDPQKGAVEAKEAMMADIEAAIGKIGSCLPIGTDVQSANETKNVKTNEKSSKADDKTLLESVFDFIMPPEKCYAATTDAVSNNNNIDSAYSNDPLNLYTKKPWEIAPTIKLPDNESYIGPASKNAIPLQDWEYER